MCSNSSPTKGSHDGSEEILDGLAERKVLIRAGGSLGREGWARTTIGTPAENRRFLAALRAVKLRPVQLEVAHHPM